MQVPQNTWTTPSKKKKKFRVPSAFMLTHQVRLSFDSHSWCVTSFLRASSNISFINFAVQLPMHQMSLFSIYMQNIYSWNFFRGLQTSLTRFSLTIPSLAAKKAKMWEMKCFSSAFKRSQCAKSLDRSTLKKKKTHQKHTCFSSFISCVDINMCTVESSSSSNCQNLMVRHCCIQYFLPKITQ